MNLQELYNSSMDFMLYVNAWCKKAGITPEEAFKLDIVQEYAKYVLTKEPKDA